jgi:hypothetical protein
LESDFEKGKSRENKNPTAKAKSRMTPITRKERRGRFGEGATGFDDKFGISINPV